MITSSSMNRSAADMFKRQLRHGRVAHLGTLTAQGSEPALYSWGADPGAAMEI